MPVPPNHGFPESQPSRAASSDGTGTISNEMVQREQAYQDAITKRNKLLLDPNPVRALQALREETRKLAEEEKKYGAAVKERMALMSRGGTIGGGVVMGNGITSPIFSFGGPIQHVQPQVPQNAAQATGAGGTPAPKVGPSAMSRTFSTIGALATAGNQAMNVVDAYNRPFQDSRSANLNALRSLPGVTGDAFSALTRLQMSLQRHGLGMSREEQHLKETATMMEPGTHYLPLEQFRLDYDVERLKAAQFLPAEQRAAIAERFSGDSKNPMSWGIGRQGAGVMRSLTARTPDGYQSLSDLDRLRSSLAESQNYQQKSEQLPALRAVDTETRQLNAQKTALEALILLRKRYRMEGEAETRRSQDYSARAEGMEAVEASKFRAMAAASAAKAAGLQRLAMQADDRIQSQQETVAQQNYRLSQAKADVKRVDLDQLTRRESIAASQAQNLIAMGPADRIAGMHALQLLQEQQKGGNDLSNIPPELWQMAGAYAPETVRKMQEQAGGALIQQAKAAGALPSDEYRDTLPDIRSRVNAKAKELDTDVPKMMGELFQDLFNSLEKMTSRDNELLLELRRQIDSIKLRQYFENNAGKAGGG